MMVIPRGATRDNTCGGGGGDGGSASSGVGRERYSAAQDTGATRFGKAREKKGSCGGCKALGSTGVSRWMREPSLAERAGGAVVMVGECQEETESEVCDGQLRPPTHSISP